MPNIHKYIGRIQLPQHHYGNKNQHYTKNNNVDDYANLDLQEEVYKYKLSEIELKKKQNALQEHACKVDRMMSQKFPDYKTDIEKEIQSQANRSKYYWDNKKRIYDKKQLNIKYLKPDVKEGDIEEAKKIIRDIFGIQSIYFKNKNTKIIHPKRIYHWDDFFGMYINKKYEVDLKPKYWKVNWSHKTIIECAFHHHHFLPNMRVQLNCVKI